MINWLKAKWLGLTEGLWFIPALVGTGYGALAVALVEADRAINWTDVDYVFRGDDSAARTVLSTIAGSLITVAGLTFSITIVVLQLTSSQFSPRVLRNLFGDRMTQITVGTFVGIFVYSLLVLRAVGDFGEDTGFVPRLSVTVGTALAIVAVGMLVAFIHHVSQVIQVSHIAGDIGRRVLDSLEQLYPEEYGEAVEAEEAAAAADRWRAEAAPGLVYASRPGYVQLIGVDGLAGDFDHPPERLHLTVAPGDFVSSEQAIAEVWPAEAAERCGREIRRAVTVADERDLKQDAAFGLRQLADIALKAISPGINDPTTAVTCIGYLRSALVVVAKRDFPSAVRRFPSEGLLVAARGRSFEEYLEPFREIGRYAAGDARVVSAALEALSAIARAATQANARTRADTTVAVARTLAGQSIDEAGNDHDRALVARLLREVETAAAVRPTAALVGARDTGAVLLLNPASGPDDEGREALIRRARELGVEVRECGEGADLGDLARAAADDGAEVLGAAGGDGSLAAVAAVAVERDVAFVPVPFGTRNHFARDLGLDPDDPAAALDAFAGPERRVDVATVNGRVFLNNVSLGVYAAAVHDPEYGKRRDIAFRRMLAAAWRLRRHPLRLEVQVDGRTERHNALVLLVGNNEYRLSSLADIGAERLRERLDEGALHAYAVERRRWLGVLAVVSRRKRAGWSEWSCSAFRVESDVKRVKAAIDGDPVELEPPLEFESRPAALRVRVPER